MARIIQLDENVFVAPQLIEADFAELAARGFGSVVDNRPDGEAPAELQSAEAKEAAERSGLSFRYHPITYQNLTDDAVVAEYARLKDELPGPILFYCRSGNRCTMLWAQDAAAKLGVDRTLEIASAAGFNLEDLRENLRARAARGR